MSTVHPANDQTHFYTTKDRVTNTIKKSQFNIQ